MQPTTASRRRPRIYTMRAPASDVAALLNIDSPFEYAHSRSADADGRFVVCAWPRALRATLFTADTLHDVRRIDPTFAPVLPALVSIAAAGRAVRRATALRVLSDSVDDAADAMASLDAAFGCDALFCRAEPLAAGVEWRCVVVGRRRVQY